MQCPKIAGIRDAVQELAPLAKRYHRSKDTALVMIDVAFPELCRTIIEHPEMTSAQRVDRALDSHLSAGELLFCHLCWVQVEVWDLGMCSVELHVMRQGIDRAGKRFWGAHQTFTQRRTVRDTLMITYHDAAEQILAG